MRVLKLLSKFMLHYSNMDYKSRLLSLEMLPLSYRREIQDRLYFFKCKAGHYDTNWNTFVQFNSKGRPTTRLSLDPFKLSIPRCNFESHKAFYFLFKFFLQSDQILHFNHLRPKFGILQHKVQLQLQFWWCISLCRKKTPSIGQVKIVRNWKKVSWVWDIPGEV